MVDPYAEAGQRVRGAEEWPSVDLDLLYASGRILTADRWTSLTSLESSCAH